MAELWAHLPGGRPPPRSTSADSRGTSLESRCGSGRRTNDGPAPGRPARRAFLDAISTGELAGHRLAQHRGRPVELQVTVAATTLLGLDDSPGQLRGYGPFTADVVRDLAPDSRRRRILTTATGAVLDVGTTTYRPPSELIRHVQVRDQSCTFPGCGWSPSLRPRPHRPLPGGTDVSRQPPNAVSRHHGSRPAARHGSSNVPTDHPLDDAHRPHLRDPAARGRPAVGATDA